jgi:hypothetical protein
MKTVWVYVNTDALPGDADHVHVFASEAKPRDGQSCCGHDRILLKVMEPGLLSIHG